MAGMVSGSRQRNSIVRASHRTRSRTQIMVGTSSTSMTAQVMTASSRVISIELIRGGMPVPE